MDIFSDYIRKEQKKTSSFCYSGSTLTWCDISPADENSHPQIEIKRFIKFSFWDPMGFVSVVSFTYSASEWIFLALAFSSVAHLHQDCI